jgi:hypothetical protein
MNENLMNFKCEYDPGVIKKKRSPIVHSPPHNIFKTQFIYSGTGYKQITTALRSTASLLKSTIGDLFFLITPGSYSHLKFIRFKLV